MNPGSENFLTDLMIQLHTQFAAGANNILPDALWILASLATIELSLALLANIAKGEDPIMLIVNKLFKFGFFYWLLSNWATGMNITKMFFDTFQNFGVKAALGGGDGITGPAKIGEIGIYLVDNLIKSIFNVSTSTGVMGNLGLIILKLFIMLVILACFFWMALLLFLVCLEFYMSSTLTIVLLPFGVNRHTSFIGEKAIGAVLSFCFQVMVLQFVLCTVIPMTSQWAQIEVQNNDLTPVFRAVLGCLAVAFLTWKASELSQGLFSGTPSLHGGDAIGGMRAATSMATGGVGSAVSNGFRVAGFGQAAANATGGRNANGSVNWGGTAKNMGTMMWQQSAYRQSRMQGKTLMAEAAGLKKEDKAKNAQRAQTTLDL
jgi:type IV secretion system protein TrbL